MIWTRTRGFSTIAILECFEKGWPLGFRPGQEALWRLREHQLVGCPAPVACHRHGACRLYVPESPKGKLFFRVATLSQMEFASSWANTGGLKSISGETCDAPDPYNPGVFCALMMGHTGKHEA